MEDALVGGGGAAPGSPSAGGVVEEPRVAAKDAVLSVGAPRDRHRRAG